MSTANPTSPRSQAAYSRALKVIPGGTSRSATWFAPHPPFVQTASGCWITDVDGRRILDASNNYLSLIHGHAFAPVVEAVIEAVRGGSAFAIPTRHESALAELISSRAQRCEHIRFCNSGTEAMMNAVKGARALTGRTAFAKFEGAYHGSYEYLEVSVTPEPSNWDDAQGNPASVLTGRGTPPHVAGEVVVLPFGDAQRCRRILDAQGSRLAAIVLDPISSKIAMAHPSADLVQVVRDACAKHGMLLICDEVVSYRLANAGAHALVGLEPDFIALGKIIGGGLPVGAVCGPAERMKVFDHTARDMGVATSGTFSANPLTMAAGLAALSHFDDAAVHRLNGLGENLRQRVAQGLQVRGLNAQFMGVGSLARLHLTRAEVKDYRTAWLPAAGRRALERIHAAALARGVLLTPNCSVGLSTPMGAAEVEQLAAVIVDSVAQVARENPW